MMESSASSSAHTEEMDFEVIPIPSTSETEVGPSPAPKATTGSGSRKSKVKDFSLNEEMLLPKVDERILSLVFPKDKQPSQASQDLMEVASEVADDNPFVAAAIAATQEESWESFTEKGAPTYSSSGDPRVDFFFGVMEQTQEETTLSLLKKSWNKEPLHTLKLLANLRDIKKGKGIRAQYQECLYWLYENHPKTLYTNLEDLMNVGYWKDLLHLLVIVMFDGYMHPFFKQDANPAKTKRKKTVPTKYQLKNLRKQKRFNEKLNEGHIYKSAAAKPSKPESNDGWFEVKSRRIRRSSKPKGRRINYRNADHLLPRAESSKAERMQYDAEKRIFNQKIVEYYKLDVLVDEMQKNEMNKYRIQYAREKLKTDMKYRVFHLKIAELFAKQMISDLNILKAVGDSKKKTKADISLAAKWAPSLDHHFDKFTLISSTIAIQIAFQTGNPEMANSQKSIPIRTYLARKSYHKDYCVPLRTNLEIPERFMSENRWGEVNYKRVPAKCMTKNKGLFINHDNERFVAYLQSKTAKVAGATLKPVDIICRAMNLQGYEEEAERILIEKQWESLTESIKKSGCLLKDAVCICDVSGSMSGVPMSAAIGLTLITMSMTSPPWNSICITFAENPTLFHLREGLPLLEKLQDMRTMHWGGTTNLHKSFELIVNLGVEKKVPNEKMPKLLFVFTDMEFDMAFQYPGKTNFEAAKELFEKNGYTMPTIVFWNLRDSSHATGTSTPVQKNEHGAILLSGFAAQTLSYIMNAKDLTEITPLTFLLEIVNDDRYKNLVVSD